MWQLIRLRSASVLMAIFGQGVSQFLTIASAFVCVHVLSIEGYAEYTVVYGLLATLGILTDVGMLSTLASLVGENIDDLNAIADYLASINDLRSRFFGVVCILAAPAFFVLSRRQHWDYSLIGIMFCLLVASLLANTITSVHGAVLLLRRERAYYYRVQAGIACIRLFGVLALMGLHRLTAVSAVCVATMAAVLNAWWYRARAIENLGRKGSSQPHLRHHIIRLALPNMPSTVFYAFQGQISTLIITWFGVSTSIAGVGALARTGQLFTAITQLSPVFVEPYFSRLPKGKLKRTYTVTVAVAAVAVALVVTFVHLWPSVPLLLLGHQYRGLTREVTWTFASAGCAYLAGLFWSINTARRFVYWWASWITIVAIIALQVVFAWNFDLSHVLTVVMMGFASAVVTMLINAAVAVRGLVVGPRSINKENFPSGN